MRSLGEIINNGFIYFTVNGDSIRESGIGDGSVVAANKKKKPKNKDIVIASVNGSICIKRFFKTDKYIILQSENKSIISDKLFAKENEIIIYGVVQHVYNIVER